jgi:hypothetical protein
MLTTPAKARKLLKAGKARAVQTAPFTIQLIYGSSGYTQPITLGVDSGYENIGLSAVTDKQELFSAEVKLRDDISDLLTERRTYRRARRNRLWHRPPRFDNRKKPDGSLPPSIQHKLDSHLRIIDKVSRILPITNIIVETANFDIQKINNPDIAGAEYQNGVQKGFENVKAYVRARDNYTCQICGKKAADIEVHHIIPRSQGGTNKPDNLITLCSKCHKHLHTHPKELEKLQKTKHSKQFKAETFMSVVRWMLANKLKELGYAVTHTYGYLTKSNRIALGLPKTHANDAFCIAGAKEQARCTTIYFQQVRRNRRSLEYFYDAHYIDKRDGKIRSGKELSGELRKYRLTKTKKGKRSIRKEYYRYHSGDIVIYNGKKYTLAGMQNHGTYALLKELSKPVKTDNIRLYKYASGFMVVAKANKANQSLRRIA